jgi:integration host factor subunit alpha
MHILPIPVPTGSHPRPIWKATTMTLTREAITRSVFDRLDLSKAASAEAVKAIFETIKKTLEGSEDVLISGLGKFCVYERKKRRGEKPCNGPTFDVGQETGCDLQEFACAKKKAEWQRGLIN